ncbi:MAG: cofilin [Tremellales sp. Tagirdzhanova-0007]|nr:MAG: cofilin [Tremellales sp. Tagirdzhanova-0007]
MSSGVQPTPECLEKFQELKQGKKLSYIIYGLSEDKRQIVVQKVSNDKDFDKFVAELPEKDCRWGVYDYEFELPGGEGIRNKIVFVQWSPDDASVKSKMIFASSKDALRRRLEGIHIEIQATDYSEITKEAGKSYRFHAARQLMQFLVNAHSPTSLLPNLPHHPIALPIASPNNWNRSCSHGEGLAPMIAASFFRTVPFGIH